MKIKFEKVESSRAGTIWLNIEYMGGDADTEHFNEEKFDFPYSDYKNHLKEIENRVNQYNIIKKLTDGSGGTQRHKYEDLKEEYGEDIADMYESVPNDPQADYQFKTSLRYLTLIGYDDNGNKYKSYI